MINCDTCHELSIAYATSGLDAAGTRQLLNHLAHCRDCCNYLNEMTGVLHLLPYGLPTIPPPADLRSQVLEAVHREQVEQHQPSVAHPVHARPRRQPILAWTAAVALGWVLLAGSLWLTYAQNRQLQAEMASASRQLQATAALLGEGQAQPMIISRMERGNEFKQAWGRVTIYDTSYGYVIVLAAGGLPKLQPGEVYRVWLNSAGARSDEGSFIPDASGYGAIAIQAKELSFETVGITLEPDQKAMPGPRGPRVLLGRL